MHGCTLKGNKSFFSVFASLLVEGQHVKESIAPAGESSVL